jgi:diaminopimelate decarboxylase
MEKKPFATLDQVRAIAEAVPTPFHLYDETGIRERARAVNAAFAWNPGFREHFAVKATPNPALLQILHEEGCGVDCSSYTELLLAQACGFEGHEIMFSANETPALDMYEAGRLGALINLDDITMVDFLEQTVSPLPTTVFCRYNPGGVFEFGNGIMDNPGDAKYGMGEKDLVEAFTRLKALGVEDFGIHAFLASNTVSNDYYPALASELFSLAVRVSRAAGVHIGYINLSGGIGVDYRPEQPANDIAVIGAGVHEAYDRILVPAGMGDVAILTELGRFMLAPFGALVTTAIHEKHTYKEYVGVDACAANLMRPAIYGAYHHVTVLGKEGEPATVTYDVVGGLCENCDKFAVDRALPKIDMGDLLFIHDAGAHGHAMGYNYNGKLRSAEVLLCEDGGYRLIRRAETPADYFATLGFDGAAASSVAGPCGEALPMLEGLEQLDAQAQADFAADPAGSWKPGC